MQIQRINNINIQPFGARVKFDRAGDISGIDLGSSDSASTASVVGASSASGVVGTATNTTGLGSDLLGTAFSSEAIGTNSSGLVPSAIEIARPLVTPETLAFMENSPATMGTIFSTLGSMLNGSSAASNSSKDPS